ncbi:CHAT domain-containing protein [Roseateles chitinivorans]|uniref:CHAT domain-containing protein n=2 Tax=Roseateles TaxID=93681 RepID=UPI003D67BFA2
MVGDLLSLAFLPAAERKTYRRVFWSFFEDTKRPHPDQALLDPLFEALERLHALDLKPGTFVRVASPSRGTLLADRRTDLFLSLLLRCVGMAGGNATPWYETFNGFVRSFVAARSDARLVPGLEAMIPGSALTLALNAVAGLDDPDGGTTLPEPPRLPGALRVIAGDAEASGIGGLFTLIGDAFYGLHDHDFVVHTHSMFGGFQRADAKSLRLERKGLHHLNYFKSDAPSRAPLFNALAGEHRDFRPLREDERITRGMTKLLKLDPLSARSPQAWVKSWSERPELNGKPVLVVLPGIMGSELAQDGRSVWIGLGAMLSGRLTALELDPAKPDVTSLKATGVMSVAYERLLEAASRQFRVMAWPFDWRRSLVDLGADLRRQLDTLLDTTRQGALDGGGEPTLHLLAHSMGGLVARAALFHRDPVRFNDPAAEPSRDDGHFDTPTWLALKRRGGRLLMLGTPNLGSYAPVQLLAQQHRMSQLLALMAREVSGEDLARYGTGFDGLLQMLPADAPAAVGDLFQDASWQTLQRRVPSVRRPDPRTLKRAREWRDWRDRSFRQLRDAADPQVLYVAGSGLTPVELALPAEPGGALDFVQSLEGDGTVPWSSRLAPAQTWYADCGHGDLGDHPDAFPAYFELLRQGRTRNLPQLPPLGWQEVASRAAGAGAVPAATLRGSAIPGTPPSLPEDPAAYALGLTGDRGDRSRARLPEPPIEVNLVHGSLDYARFPLIVGHNLEECLAGGTRRVDEKLDGQLQRMLDLKLFVGADRTSAYLRPPARDHRPPAYPGALVLGLGAIGELTPSSLTATVTRGVLRYAFEHLTRDCWVEGEGPLPLRLSTLLIGTHMQAVSFRDSLAGVLMGVWNANQHLARDTGGRIARVVELEIIEIFEHSALDAAYELERLLRNPDWARRVNWPGGTLQTRAGGLFGYRRRDGDNVWQRLIVTQSPLGGLRFELIAERARVEATQVRSDVASLSSFIQQLSDDGVVAAGSGRDEERALGQVFFQLLLPQALKGRMTNFEPTVLVVDDRTAGYPWELMTPPEDDAGAGDVRPLAVQAGLVRQRVTAEFRALPQTLNTFEALVIGAPSTARWKDRDGAPLRFAELPGALAEARDVEARLRQDTRPWRVTALLGAEVTARQVRMALLARPYRLLHLSAHGAYDLWVSDVEVYGATQKLRKTGVLLSDQEVLSAADVEQMGNVPEFVFINCCYLGRDPDRASLAPIQRNDPEMAAGLALKFIQMGAKAVIAAGWQVQDDAGALFARCLYDGLLTDGLDFGTAVLEARRSVRDAHGGNTWGAYQCYGDPNWRFVASGAGDHQAPGGSSHLRGSEFAKSAGELANQLQKVSAVSGDKPRDALRRQLREVLDTLARDPVRKGWLSDSQVASALSMAWRELGEYQLSLDAAQLGSRQVDSLLSMRDIEAAANSLVRTGSTASVRQADELLKTLDLLETQLVKAGSGKGRRKANAAAADTAPAVSLGQAERSSLRGSIQLRSAAARLKSDTGSAVDANEYIPEEDLAKTVADLARAAEGYADSYLPQREAKGPADRRCFALANALLCAGLAALGGDATQTSLAKLAKPPGSWSLDTQALLEELKACELSAQFWHYTGAFELRTARALLLVALGQVPKGATGPAGTVADAAGAWLDEELGVARRQLEIALVRWPSPAEKDSLTVRLRLMRAVCDQSTDGDKAGRLRVIEHVRAAAALLNGGGPARRG